MAPAIITTLRNLVTTDSDVSALGPLAARSLLLGRDGDDKGNADDPPSGVIDPHSINNKIMFSLFGLIGVAFVVTGIWFFFWAKNGGFYFHEKDWDDYKSTVLRRRGPNGTILSGATESTDLGGGSVYKDVDDGSTEVSGSTGGLTNITGGVSDFAGRERKRKRREQKEREKERRREERSREKEERKRGGGSRKVGADGVLVDDEAEAEAKEHLRSYRHERPARVGGLNKESEGSAWDGSTNPSHSTASGSGAGTESTVTTELISNRERTPTSTPTGTPTKRQGGGIRKVYSTADKTASREAERVRAEARRLQERGRAAAGAAPSSSRRDFSWQRADDMGLRRIEEGASSVTGGGGSSRGDQESHVPGGWVGSDVGTNSEAGTKVYRHSVHVPGTATSDFAYAEEKRKRRNGAGHRRARDDDGR
ncbi:hypothetical protein QBC33DRAFT_265235 [Phialemonium atrogriseum]|uniref:Endosomal spry domain-containing protein n=1 Tax=Phialemonium atrogriseum TaxID=1093897 RepID=A0AAJ0C572_9PEZI|nr:uncharacterized protein QBC33DRAFT_265235 [Phialemonium atrogriseum]KAK1770379.1 hypothetical protein QBC33DRAFT_265235 [Phialemonium atrogriseum]